MKPAEITIACRSVGDPAARERNRPACINVRVDEHRTSQAQRPHCPTLNYEIKTRTAPRSAAFPQCNCCTVSDLAHRLGKPNDQR